MLSALLCKLSFCEERRELRWASSELQPLRLVQGALGAGKSLSSRLSRAA